MKYPEKNTHQSNRPTDQSYVLKTWIEPRSS